MRVDPTKPLYEGIPKKIVDAVDLLVDEVGKFIKLTNPKAMIGWNDEDNNELAFALREQYCREDIDDGMAILRQTFQRFKNLAAEKLLDFGDFYRLTHVTKKDRAFIVECKATFCDDSKGQSNDWRDEARTVDARHQERVKNAPKHDSRAIKNYWIKCIKEDMKRAGIQGKQLGKLMPWLNK